MKPLDQVGTDALVWERGGAFSREHTLRAGDDLVASLQFNGWGRREAIAESAEGRWTIRREHWYSRAFALRDLRLEREVARFESRWFGRGTLTFEAGDAFESRLLHLWHGEWGFVRENGEPVVRFRRRPSLFHDRATVTFEPGSLSSRQRVAMALVGRCVMIRPRHRGAH